MITVNDTGVQVVIGRAGENVFRTIQVDVSAWLSDYPDCQITAVFRRPDGVGYAVPLERWGESVVWKPTETDTVRGRGALELRVRVDKMLGKSVLIETICMNALLFPENTTPPTDLPPGADVGQVLTWTLDGATWRDPQGIADEVVQKAVEEYLKENPPASGVDFTTDATLNLDPVTKVLSVNTADEPEADNTLPITAAAVHNTVGNIEILLGTI